ncbi:MAG: hypothetical protein C4560_02930 [Nitrospiraceae bacterium]|nr:MAG: hypothetical protein C4560_02930 [Nitrospiraceae bacterium]
MKLATARVCIQCEEIFDHIRTLQAGTGDARVCPSCLSKSTVLLSKYVQTMADFEKNGSCCAAEVPA